MGEQTDKIAGRAKQAVGAVAGDEETKRGGERQEDKGKLKGKGRLSHRHGAGRAWGSQGQGRGGARGRQGQGRPEIAIVRAHEDDAAGRAF